MATDNDAGNCLDRAIGKAIQAARKTHPKLNTQTKLAEAVGVEQTRISYWELGKNRVPLESLVGLETVLGLRRGELLIRAGIVELDPAYDVESAIAADPHLAEPTKALILAFYRGEVSRAGTSRSRRGRRATRQRSG